jgi:hypothetical protein
MIHLQLQHFKGTLGRMQAVIVCELVTPARKQATRARRMT